VKTDRIIRAARGRFAARVTMHPNGGRYFDESKIERNADGEFAPKGGGGGGDRKAPNPTGRDPRRNAPGGENETLRAIRKKFDPSGGGERKSTAAPVGKRAEMAREMRHAMHDAGLAPGYGTAISPKAKPTREEIIESLRKGSVEAVHDRRAVAYDSDGYPVLSGAAPETVNRGLGDFPFVVVTYDGRGHVAGISKKKTMDLAEKAAAKNPDSEAFAYEYETNLDEVLAIKKELGLGESFAASRPRTDPTQPARFFDESKVNRNDQGEFAPSGGGGSGKSKTTIGRSAGDQADDKSLTDDEISPKARKIREQRKNDRDTGGRRWGPDDGGGGSKGDKPTDRPRSRTGDGATRVAGAVEKAIASGDISIKPGKEDKVVKHPAKRIGDALNAVGDAWGMMDRGHDENASGKMLRASTELDEASRSVADRATATMISDVASDLRTYGRLLKSGRASKSDMVGAGSAVDWAKDMLADVLRISG